MMHSQEMYDQLPILPQSTCGAILKEIGFLGGGGILGNSDISGGVFWEIHRHIGGGVFWEIHRHICGGVFWEIHIHIFGGGGYSGNLNLIPE